MMGEDICISRPRRPRDCAARQESRPLQSGAAEPWDLAAGIDGVSTRGPPGPPSPVYLLPVGAECVSVSDPVEDDGAYEHYLITCQFQSTLGKVRLSCPNLSQRKEQRDEAVRRTSRARRGRTIKFAEHEA